MIRKTAECREQRAESQERAERQNCEPAGSLLSALRSPLSSQRRHGAVALLVAICLTVLVGILAIAVDGGMLLSEQRHAQATADAAAMAAATVLFADYPAHAGVD